MVGPGPGRASSCPGLGPSSTDSGRDVLGRELFDQFDQPIVVPAEARVAIIAVVAAVAAAAAGEREGGWGGDVQGAAVL